MNELMAEVVKTNMGDVRISLTLDAELGSYPSLIYRADYQTRDGSILSRTICSPLSSNRVGIRYVQDIRERLLRDLGREAFREVA